VSIVLLSLSTVLVASIASFKHIALECALMLQVKPLALEMLRLPE
jgi:hypothetical protein